jgi:hypothetical protein
MIGRPFMMQRFETLVTGEEKEFDVLEADVIEIPLLLAGWQVSALETAAHDRGLTAAEMVRHVLGDFLARLDRKGSTFSPVVIRSRMSRT